MNKMATVVGFFEETKTAKIQFDGEEKAAEKEYPYLSSYSPKLDDKVFCLEFGESFIILGEVTFQKKPFDLDDTLTKAIDPTRKELKALSDKHDVDKTELTTKIEANAKSIEANKTSITSNKTSADNSIRSLWNSVNSNTENLKSAQRTADSAVSKFNDLEKKVSSNTSKINANKTEFDRSKMDIKNNYSSISSAQSSIRTLENDVKSLKSRVTALERK